MIPLVHWTTMNNRANRQEMKFWAIDLSMASYSSVTSFTQSLVKSHIYFNFKDELQTQHTRVLPIHSPHTRPPFLLLSHDSSRFYFLTNCYSWVYTSPHLSDVYERTGTHCACCVGQKIRSGHRIHHVSLYCGSSSTLSCHYNTNVKLCVRTLKQITLVCHTPS